MVYICLHKNDVWRIKRPQENQQRSVREIGNIYEVMAPRKSQSATINVGKNAILVIQQMRVVSPYRQSVSAYRWYSNVTVDCRTIQEKKIWRTVSPLLIWHMSVFCVLEKYTHFLQKEREQKTKCEKKEMTCSTNSSILHQQIVSDGATFCSC